MGRVLLPPSLLINAKILETKFPSRKHIESFLSILLFDHLPSDILEMEFNFSVLAFHPHGLMTNDLMMMFPLFRKFHFTSCTPDQENDGFSKVTLIKMAGDRKHLFSVGGSPK